MMLLSVSVRCDNPIVVQDIHHRIRDLVLKIFEDNGHQEMRQLSIEDLSDHITDHGSICVAGILFHHDLSLPEAEARGFTPDSHDMRYGAL